MSRYVIDARTLLHLVDQHVLLNPDHGLVAPTRIRSELTMRLQGDRMSRGTAWKIARAQGWPTLRDAEYLAVTRLQADALVTVDPELAAKADGIVPVAPWESLLAAD